MESDARPSWRTAAPLSGVPMKIIDLTIPLVDGMDAYPGEPSAAFTRFSTLADGGVEMWNVSLFSQLGTHVDAPSHFIGGGTTIEKLDLAKGIGSAAVVDAGSSGAVTAADLSARIDDLRTTRRLVVRTGTSARLGTPGYWTGFPELELDAVELLLDCDVEFVGLDTPTPSLTHLHQTHHRLLGADILVAECLTGVAALSAVTYIVCLPLPLAGLDGSPARVVALEPVDA
ncbi:cyclase family protein [Pseudonocardia spinosispora]|uniref:cyclase family protein n=1 Tax=Pseudonocardia spinosispora TaxID=103441 RepID=UPI00048B0205|nr:cyclase family protein [Pseudonocardia spinosispora]